MNKGLLEGPEVRWEGTISSGCVRVLLLWSLDAFQSTPFNVRLEVHQALKIIFGLSTAVYLVVDVLGFLNLVKKQISKSHNLLANAAASTLVLSHRSIYCWPQPRHCGVLGLIQLEFPRSIYVVSWTQVQI